MGLVGIILQSDMELKPATQEKLLGPFGRRVVCLWGSYLSGEQVGR